MSSSNSKLPEGLVTSDGVQGHHVIRMPWQAAVGILALIVIAGGGYYVYHAHKASTAASQQSQPTKNAQLELDPKKELASAQAELNQAKTAQQKSAAYTNIGTAYLNGSQTDQAIAAFQSAISADPSHQEAALSALANAYMEAGQKDQEIRTLKQLVSVLQQSNDPALQAQVGQYQQLIQQLQNGGGQ